MFIVCLLRIAEDRQILISIYVSQLDLCYYKQSSNQCNHAGEIGHHSWSRKPYIIMDLHMQLWPTNI